MQNRPTCWPLQLRTNITIKPPHWLPNYPHLRPADVSIQLSSPPSPNCPTPINRIAIDVTVSQTPDFLHYPLDLFAPSVIAQQAYKAHHNAACKKFMSRRNNSLIIHGVNQAGIMLLPFTVDLFGQVGHFFHGFLFPNDTIIPYPGDGPPWLETTDSPHYSPPTAPS